MADRAIKAVVKEISPILNPNLSTRGLYDTGKLLNAIPAVAAMIKTAGHYPPTIKKPFAIHFYTFLK